MSVASDLASAFAELAFTVPVSCGASSTRAFFNRAGSVVKVGGVGVQLEHDTLFVQRGTLDPDVKHENAQVQVGELGDVDATAGDWYDVGDITPMDDGLISQIVITGGPS